MIAGKVFVDLTSISRAHKRSKDPDEWWKRLSRVWDEAPSIVMDLVRVIEAGSCFYSRKVEIVLFCDCPGSHVRAPVGWKCVARSKGDRRKWARVLADLVKAEKKIAPGPAVAIAERESAPVFFEAGITTITIARCEREH